jgi:hypothetical protein
MGNGGIKPNFASYTNNELFWYLWNVVTEVRLIQDAEMTLRGVLECGIPITIQNNVFSLHVLLYISP